jgi:hypothetical protein
MLLGTIRQRIAALTQRRPPIRTADAFCAFLAGEAAHVAQSATYDYLRARAGRMAPQLFREKPFLDALEVTRWEAFAAVLADLMVIAQNELRAHVADGALLSERLEAMHRAILGDHPVPAHRADGWTGHETKLSERLAATRAAPAQRADRVAGSSGMAIFKHLPLHPDVRRLDEEMVVTNVRFRILRSWETFKERVDVAAVADSLMTSEDAQSR